MEELKEEKNSIYKLPNSPNELLSQIIDAYPEEDFQSLRKVIGIGKVLYMETLPGGIPATAAVVNTKPYTLIFGKSFMENHMKSMEDCVYLLSHELTHLVLDHFARDIVAEFTEKKLGSKAVHIITDCQVNATCCNSLLDEKYFGLLKNYYSKTNMPECFFRPDGEPPTDDLKELHARLFSKDGITNKDLIDGLMPWFEQHQDQLDEMTKKCLGNHKDLMKDKSGDNNNSELDDLIEAVGQDLEDVLNREKKKEEAAEGIGEEKKEESEGDGNQGGSKKGCDPKGDAPREKYIKTSLERIQYAKNIKRQLNKVEVVSPSSRIYKAIEAFFPKKPCRTVIPNFYDRRTAALYSQGHLPIFHMNTEKGSKVQVPCYLDVSGSQDHVIPYMLPVVSRLKQKIGNLVYCFSNYIAETPINKLEVGKIKTSGGTDFNPVMEHILKHNFKNAIILTDGDAHLREDLMAKIKSRRINITVGWTVERPRLSPLDKIASKTFYVFEDNAK